MKKYSAWLSDGTEREYEAKTEDSAINKGKKLAKKSNEILIRIYDITNLEISEECPTIWKR